MLKAYTDILLFFPCYAAGVQKKEYFCSDFSYSRVEWSYAYSSTLWSMDQTEFIELKVINCFLQNLTSIVFYHYIQLKIPS